MFTLRSPFSSLVLISSKRSIRLDHPKVCRFYQLRSLAMRSQDVRSDVGHATPCQSCISKRHLHLTSSRAMFIQVEETPNPNSLKFYPGETVLESGTADFQDKVQASLKSPLAKALFRIKGVRSVFFAQNFVTVSKEDDEKIEWNILKPQISDAIEIFYTIERPLLYSSNDPGTNTGDRSYEVKEKTIKDRVSSTGQKDSGNDKAGDNKARRKFQADRILTLPNILTASRIACAPAMGYFIWSGMYQQALACFAFAAATDLLDGLIARAFKQESDFGVVLDPIADKILLTTCFIAMYNTNLLPLWLVQGFVMRDISLLLAGSFVRYFAFIEKPTMRKYLDLKNYPSIGFQPTMTSKCNTALQCLIILLHLSTNHLAGDLYYDLAIKALHVITAGTSVISMSQYIHRAIELPRIYKAQSKMKAKI